MIAGAQLTTSALSVRQLLTPASALPNPIASPAADADGDFHTQPALQGAGFDYGTSNPQDVLKTLSDHCGDLTCDESWTVDYKKINGGQLVSGTLKVSVTDADWDGSDVGKNMTGGIIQLGGVGVSKKKKKYDDYNGSIISESKSAEFYKGYSKIALGRFKSVSAFAS